MNFHTTKRIMMSVIQAMAEKKILEKLLHFGVPFPGRRVEEKVE